LEKRRELQEATIRTLQEKVEELEEKLQAEYSKEAIIRSLEGKLEVQQKVDEEADEDASYLEDMDSEREQQELASGFLSLQLKRKDSEIDTMKTIHLAQVSELKNKLEEKDSEIEKLQAKIIEVRNKAARECLSESLKKLEWGDYKSKIFSLEMELSDKDYEILRLEERLFALELEQKKELEERCVEAWTTSNVFKWSIYFSVILGSVLFFFGRNML
jgi:hypothetical protein